MPSNSPTGLVGVDFARRRAFRCGAFLLEAGCPATSVYLLTRGQVRCFSLSEEGGEATTAVLGPGQLVGATGLFGVRINPLFVQALTPVCAWAMPTAQLRAEVWRSPMLLGLLTGALAQRAALAEGLLRAVLLLPVRDRLGDIQVRLAATLGGRPALNRAQLAGLVQARPETLARVVATEVRPHGSATHDQPLVREFRAGAILTELDAPPAHIHQLIRGELQIALAGADRRQCTIQRLGAGDFVGIAGLVGLPPTGLKAKALTDGALRTLSADEFLRQVTADPARLEALAQQLGTSLMQIERQLSFAAAGTARQRLVAYLREIERQAPAGLPPSHKLLAHGIGASRETVTRALRALEQEGVIVRDGRRVRLRAPSDPRVGKILLLAQDARQQPQDGRRVQ